MVTLASRVSAPPTAEEREMAHAAAAALRGAMADPATMGTASVMHVDLSRPRRAEWFTTWPGLPGFVRASDWSGRRYTHALLPGW